MSLSSLRSDHNLRSGRVLGSIGAEKRKGSWKHWGSEAEGFFGSMGARKRRCGIIWEIGDKVVILSAK